MIGAVRFSRCRLPLPTDPDGCRCICRLSPLSIVLEAELELGVPRAALIDQLELGGPIVHGELCRSPKHTCSPRLCASALFPAGPCGIFGLISTRSNASCGIAGSLETVTTTSGSTGDQLANKRNACHERISNIVRGTNYQLGVITCQSCGAAMSGINWKK